MLILSQRNHLINMPNKIDKLLEDVSYMRGKMDATFENIEKNNEKVSEILLDHGTRLGSLETQAGKISTKVGIIGGIFGAVATFLTEFLMRKY